MTDALTDEDLRELRENYAATHPQMRHAAVGKLLAEVERLRKAHEGLGGETVLWIDGYEGLRESYEKLQERAARLEALLKEALPFVSGDLVRRILSELAKGGGT